MKSANPGRLAGGLAALIGYIVAVALKDPVWPFVLILGVQAIGFIAGLAIYGAQQRSLENPFPGV
jgi:predicted benzoate:H+ symporter BenE